MLRTDSLLNNTLLKNILGVSALLISVSTSAANSPAAAPATPTSAGASTTAGDQSKDEWLDMLKQISPGIICKSFMQDTEFKKLLDESKINYDKCVSFIPAIYETCQKQVYSTLPARINSDEGSKWGRSIGECIGKIFVVKYLYASSTPAATAPTSASAAPTTPAATKP